MNVAQRQSTVANKARLRTKFLISLLLISAGLTAASLLVVRYNVQREIKQSLREELHNSVKTYLTFEKQREAMLSREAELLANLPTVRALMTTEDAATIQDESENIWRLSGSDLLVLGNRVGEVMAVRTGTNQFSTRNAQESLRTSMQRGERRGWWFSGGRLYEVWIQPIYFGPSSENMVTGVLAVGHEVNDRAAKEFGDIVSNDVVIRCAGKIVASTLPPSEGGSFLSGGQPAKSSENDSQEVQLGGERYLASTVSLSTPAETPVTLSVLKSLDKATAFLSRLNRILLGLGLLSVLAGGVLVFLISDTFTRPLATLVEGVRALEQGRFDYPLEHTSGDEVAEVTVAFDRMRVSLRNTQEEQKQLEERLRQAHKMEAVGRLAGGVAHDFNNLLTVIRGNSDLLADREGADTMQKRCVEQIQKASNRAVTMTRQLLAFSRMQVLQRQVLDLNAIVSDMGKMLPRLIGENIEFQFIAEPEIAKVLVDPGQMEQVLLNLAVNARDAMPEGGKLSVQTRNVSITEGEAGKRHPMISGKYVMLSVTDTGHGMDPETKSHIFEPFFTTKETGKGTGLGLATVYGIVKQSGGFIWVESVPGHGATFEIYLPITEKPATAVLESAKSNVLTRGTETILLVEDETGVRELASEFLRGGGYAVLEASDGVEALEVVSRHEGPIHLLISDVVMPRMGGKELAGRLKSLRPKIRVCLITGYSQFAEDSGKQLAGEFEVLQKPFTRNSLLERIRAVLTGAAYERVGEGSGNHLI